jgi:SAM-dependent methyltransferase
MSLRLSRHSELSPSRIKGLEDAMSNFYQNPPSNYYQIANQSARYYRSAEMPFHCDLVSHVFPAATVLEVGCGTAHLCPYIEEKGGVYTGLDHSESLLKDNQRRFPSASFVSIGTLFTKTFDLVASLYTLEHVADPPAYLEFLWRCCRPGGLIGILCPEFIECPGFPPSIFFGRTPRRFTQKLRSGSMIDAFSHWLDWKFSAPRWKKVALAAPAGAFWMNLRPRVLHGADYNIDTDAIHLTRLKDVVWFFQQKGAEIVQTSAQMPGVSPNVLQFNCYALIKKPDALAITL